MKMSMLLFKRVGIIIQIKTIITKNLTYYNSHFYDKTYFKLVNTFIVKIFTSSSEQEYH